MSSNEFVSILAIVCLITSIALSVRAEEYPVHDRVTQESQNLDQGPPP